MSNDRKNPDRLSVLPDSLLHEILSLLNIKQVVQTCVLSKRWKPVWTRIPTLDFDFKSYTFQGSKNHDKYRVRSFAHFVMRVLSNHCGSNIAKLSYTAWDNIEEEDKKYFIEFLLCYAGCHKVQELHLIITEKVDVDWKQCLSACQSLNVLSITCKFYYEWGSLMLPSVTILEIESSLNLSLKNSQKMFSGCPNLKSLVLKDLVWNHSCNIYAPKLEHFEILSTSVYAYALKDIKLLTPNLKSVKFRESSPIITNSPSDFPCLDIVNIEAKFDKNSLYYGVGQKLAVQIMLIMFHNARTITLPLNAAKDILFSSANLSFPNLRHLNLKASNKTKKIALPMPINELKLKFPTLATMEIDLN